MTTKTQAEIEVEGIAEDLLKTNKVLTFAARDLGFPDHTAIHGAAKTILANWMAWAIFYDRINQGQAGDDAS